MWKKEKEKNSVSQPHLQHAISQPMKLSCGDTFLFRGIELKSEMHELLSANTVKLKTREQLLTMAQEEQSEAARQNTGGEEEMDRSKQASPCVIEILDSTTECEEEAKPDRLQKEEKAFVSSLHSFMKDKGTPIERIPHLGFKQINLWRIYKAVDKLGGYDSVTARRLWKKVYDELGGSPGSTSAATCTRRHYERLVLPFERHVKGEEDKPLPPSKPRKPYKRNPESKMNKADGKRKRTLSERELDSEMCAQRSPEAACQREVMMSPHFALWAAAPEGCHSDCRQSNRPSTEFSPSANDHMLQVPISRSWVSHIPSATGEVISPLEKKKRMAQASLLAPVSSPREDKERPSVIHCSLSPARASSSRNSSDGSPFPLSSSSSRSSSPLSVSSEDSPSIKGSERPQSSSSPAKKPQEDKPVSCSQASTVPTGQSKEVSQVGAQTLTTNSAKSLKKDSAWKPYQKGTGKYFTYPFYTPSTFATSTSSFTKVAPKPVQLLRPAPLRPTYKIHQSRYQQDDSLACAKKLNSVAPWPYQTEKRERSRTLPQKVPLPQQTLSQSGTHLPTSCILSSYDKSGRDSRHQPALHPAFFPHRMRLPQSQLIYRNVPIGPGHSAVVGPAIYPYTYTFPLLNPQAGYTLPTMNPIYPHKL